MAYSKPWIKLLHYQKTLFGFESTATRKDFFLSPRGRKDPLGELKKNLKEFKNTNAACRFPARFTLLKKIWKDLKWPKECSDFEQWRKGLDAGNLYLVFSSAYPNNPASLFGHTFLRFDRNSKNESISAKKLLGYSLAFQAITDPNDNALKYTYKGITGGYQSYLEIKPYYMNVGIYNNAESRDLWEYPIKLTKNEKDLLIKHVWEISRNTTFDYYFLDENCSTLVLELIEAIKPEWSFDSGRDLFVVPQLTLKEIVEKSQSPTYHFRPAIKRNIQKRYQSLKNIQQEKVMKVYGAEDKLEVLEDIEQIDLLLDLWKLKNYEKQTNLDAQSKDQMNDALVHRSKIPGTSSELSYKEEKEYLAPHQGHGFQKASLNLISGEARWCERVSLNLRYGFHSFSDPGEGYDEKSYIQFLDLKLSSQDKSFILENFKIIDIISLRNFSWHYPQLSWNAFSWLEHNNSKSFLPSKFNLAGGVGMSKVTVKKQSYALLNVKFHHSFASKKTYVGPMLRLGFKHIWSKDFWFVLELEGDKLGPSYDYIGRGELKSRIFKKYYWGIGVSHRYQAKEAKALTSFDFYY